MSGFPNYSVSQQMAPFLYGSPESMESLPEAQLDRARYSYSMAESELRQLLKVRSTTPNMSQRETDLKDREIGSLKQRLENSEREIENLQKIVLQQKATIHNQSQAIQNPRHQQPPLYTPQRAQSTQPTFTSAPANITRIPPPPFNLPVANRSVGNDRDLLQGLNLHGRYDRQIAPHTTAMTPFKAARIQRADEFGSPASIPLQTAVGPVPSNRYVTPVHSTAMSSVTTPGTNFTLSDSPSDPFGPIVSRHQRLPQLQSSISPSVTCSPASVFEMKPSAEQYLTGAVGREIIRQFGTVFQMAGRFALSHANVPSTAGDQAMPADIKERLLKAATTTSAFPLMSNTQTRFLLVTKVIMQWLIKHVFKVDSFEGFDPEIDSRIRATKEQIYQTTPIQVRHHYLNSIAGDIVKLREKHNFKEFFTRLTRSRGNQLWAIIYPMMHNKTTCDWEDLHELVIQAHNLAATMFTGFIEYRYEFPEIGKFFESKTTEAPFMTRMSRDELEQRRAVIKLGYLPVVTAKVYLSPEVTVLEIVQTGKTIVKLTDGDRH